MGDENLPDDIGSIHRLYSCDSDISLVVQSDPELKTRHAVEIVGKGFESWRRLKTKSAINFSDEKINLLAYPLVRQIKIECEIFEFLAVMSQLENL